MDFYKSTICADTLSHKSYYVRFAQQKKTIRNTKIARKQTEVWEQKDQEKPKASG
jgi:hypothetical protein